MNFTVLWLQ